MQEFIRKHEARIHGVLSCFDRMLFRGYLPIMSGWSMAQFLNGLDVDGGSLKPFLLDNAQRVKEHAIAMAKKYERPFQYLASHIRKEDTARKLAERDGIDQGLVCIFSVLEPCRTFSFRFQKGRPFVQSAWAQVFAPVLLFHGSRFWPDPRAYSRAGFRCRSRSISTGTSGSLASSQLITCATPSTTMSLCGSKTSPERSGLRTASRI